MNGFRVGLGHVEPGSRETIAVERVNGVGESLQVPLYCFELNRKVIQLVCMRKGHLRIRRDYLSIEIGL